MTTVATPRAETALGPAWPSSSGASTIRMPAASWHGRWNQRRTGGGANLWWLDLGNSASSGQLYLGNALRAEALRGTFDRETGICRALPAPCIQAPELLEAPTAPLPITLDQDCAEAQ